MEMSKRGSCSWGALSSSRCSGTLWPAAVAQAAARATGAACAPCRWPVPTAQSGSPSTTSVESCSAMFRPCILNLATMQRNPHHLSHACNCGPPAATGRGLSRTSLRPQSAPTPSPHAHRFVLSAAVVPDLVPGTAAAFAADSCSVRATGCGRTAAGGGSHRCSSRSFYPPAPAPARRQGALTAHSSTLRGSRTASAVGLGSLWGCGPAPRRLAAPVSALTRGAGCGARRGTVPPRALSKGGEELGADTSRLGPGEGSRVGGSRGSGRSSSGREPPQQQHQQHAHQQHPGRRVVLSAGDMVHGGERRAETVEEQIARCRTLQELAWLFDRVQRGTAAAAAAGAAVKAVAAAGGAGGDDAPPGPPPPRPAAAAASASLSARHVWAFLGAAADLLAVRKGSMGKAKLPERGRQLLGRLLVDACRVVLWAERLPPAKACLLLSLVARAGRYPRAEQHLRLLAEDSLNTLEYYSPGQVALAASSFAKVGFHPGVGWLETLIEVTTGQLHEYRPQDLAFVLWALAKWRARPPAAWLQEYYSALEGCMDWVNERDLAKLCWALGALASVRHGRTAGPGPAAAAAAGAAAGPLTGAWVSPGAAAAAAAASVAGGGGLVVRPPTRLMTQLMVEAQVRMPSLGSQALAHVAWGLCCCDAQPPAFWMDELCAAARSRMHNATSGLTFSNLLWALACWRHRPSAAWLDEACKQSARWLPSLDGGSLAVLLLALADMGHTPPREWVSLALECAHRLIPGLDQSAAVSVLWAVSRFERQRAAAAAKDLPPPPPRRRQTSLTVDDVLLLAGEEVAAAAAQAWGGPGGAVTVTAAAEPGAGGTPLHLRPQRKWLVRYTPLLQDVAHAAAGILTSPAPLAPAPAPSTRPRPPPLGPAPAAAAPGTLGPPPARPALAAPPPRFRFGELDANQMLDLAVALADLYVYPGDEFMAAHEDRMAALLRGGGRDASDGGLSPYQRQLLAMAYAALDETWEGYAVPRGGEIY